MKKILFTASTYSHINNFHLPYLKYFKKIGYEVHVAVGGSKQEIEFADKVYDIPFQKSITSIENFKLAHKLSKIMKTEKYTIISTHTSLAAFFTRLAVALSGSKAYVINTVHGYLFDENFPFLKRNIMLFAEKIMKPWTDDIMVMNSDDENIARKHKLYKKNLYFIDGMGVDFSKLQFCEARDEERTRFNMKKEDIVLVYAAEFSNRKNQEMIIESLQKLPENVKLILMGNGQNYENCKLLAKKLDLEERIIFTGYVKNIDYYYSISDICVSSSRIEGLPFNVMEAMYMKLPLVVSKVKGNEDLVSYGINGYTYLYNDTDEFCEKIIELCNNDEKRKLFGQKSHELSLKYDKENIFKNILKKFPTF